jgi:hypothetical protein
MFVVVMFSPSRLGSRGNPGAPSNPLSSVARCLPVFCTRTAFGRSAKSFVRGPLAAARKH